MSDSLAARATDVEDLATARALIATLQDQLTKSQRENAALRHQLDVLCQRLFGKKSERVDARQLQLALEQLANEPGAVTEPSRWTQATRRCAAIHDAGRRDAARSQLKGLDDRHGRSCRTTEPGECLHSPS